MSNLTAQQVARQLEARMLGRSAMQITALELRALLDERRELLVSQSQEWQAIESAPKDGTRILGHREGQIGVALGMQRNDGEAWTFDGATARIDFFPEVKPTHWMPLPPAPIDNTGLSKPDRAPSEDGYPYG